jgi:tRNA threonylcarbamoyladenosine biosynthesis protein TsaB
MILALTTASARGAVALLAGEQLLAEQHYEDELRHAERLLPTIDAVTRAAAVAPTALTAVACDVGPGSFTGLRVGLATAKGIALALDLPIVGVGSLAAMVTAAFASVSGPSNQIVGLLDARRAELFFAAYGPRGEVVCPPTLVAAADLVPALASRGIDLGASWVCGRAAAGLGLPGARVEAAFACELPSAEWIARIARRRLAAAPRGDDLSALEPVYLRPVDARRPKIAPDWRR